MKNDASEPAGLETVDLPALHGSNNELDELSWASVFAQLRGCWHARASFLQGPEQGPAAPLAAGASTELRREGSAGSSRGERLQCPRPQNRCDQPCPRSSSLAERPRGGKGAQAPHLLGAVTYVGRCAENRVAVDLTIIRVVLAW